MTSQHDVGELTGVARQVAEAGAVLGRSMAQLQSQGGRPTSAGSILPKTAGSIAAIAASPVKGSILPNIAENAARYRSVLESSSMVLDAVAHSASLTPRMSSLLDASKGIADIEIKASMGLSSTLVRLSEGVQPMPLEGTMSAALGLLGGIAVSSALLAQGSLGVLENTRLGGLIGADATFRRSTSAHLGLLTRSFGGVVASFASGPKLAGSSLSVAYPSAEYLRHVEMLGSVTAKGAVPTSSTTLDAAVGEESPFVEDALGRLDGALPRLLTGARAALAGQNPDRTRHVTTSLRELLMHVVRALAPDESVIAWATEPGLIENGRPTRRGRLLYICRGIGEEPLAQFTQRDVQATLAFMDSLSAGTHVVQSALTPNQLRTVVARAESLLLYLLQIPRDAD